MTYFSDAHPVWNGLPFIHRNPIVYNGEPDFSPAWLGTSE
jgi:hypothetical protein